MKSSKANKIRLRKESDSNVAQLLQDLVYYK